jgi:MFS family permease
VLDRAVRQPAPSLRRTWLLVGSLTAATFLQWAGSSAVLPLLPVYLSRRGTPAATIGVVVSAFFVGGFLAQYVAGRYADRIGYRPVLLTGLIGYGIASAGFLLDVGGWGYAGLRAGQGAAAGAAQVAAFALVARCVPRPVRGRAFSAVLGGELAGVAVGPVAGAWLGIPGMGTLFAAAAVVALLACVPVLVLRPAVLEEHAVEPGTPGAGPAPLAWRGTRGRMLIGVLLASALGGLMTGVYEACWSLLLDARGATTWQLGASWTLFAIPFVVVSPLAGWLADHRDRRRLVIVTSMSSLAFCMAYGFITAPWWLLGLGSFEAVGVAMTMPAAQSLLADAVPAGASGRAQGLFASVNTAAVAVAALVAGGLFGVEPWLPFVTCGGLGAALVVVVAFAWRGVPGRATKPVPELA